MNSRTLRLLGALFALALFATACGDDADTTDDATEASTDEATEASTDEATEASTEEATDASTEEATADATADDEVGTIVDVAVANDFTTLVAAVEAADLVETLNSEGPFTVFAPTDEAFEALLADLDLTADELLADTELLTSVLTYHVIPEEVPAETVVTLDGTEVETVNGASVTISVDGDTVMVNDATVTATDVMASNGVIHVIDTVLVPPTS